MKTLHFSSYRSTPSSSTPVSTTKTFPNIINTVSQYCFVYMASVIRRSASRPRRDGRAPPPLHEKFSYRSSLALVLPEVHPLRARVDAIRGVYDRNHLRWPLPHVKLAYPFFALPEVPEGERPSPDLEVLARLRKALIPIRPFNFHLTFLHSLNDRNSWSLNAPSDLSPILSLQSSIAEEFKAELAEANMASGLKKPVRNDEPEDVLGEKFDAHMGLGKLNPHRDLAESQKVFEKMLFGGKEEADSLEEEGWNMNVIEAVRDGQKWTQREDPALRWEVNKIQWMWRKGSSDGFEVLDEIELGN